MESQKKFISFFSNYLWAGVVIVLITIIVDLNVFDKPMAFKILLEFFKTLGISIIVASMFTWITDSKSFIDKIQKLLRSIVINRDFLNNLDSKSKMDALKSLIKPSRFEKETYTNIDDYYDFYIERTMEISKKNVRSDYKINARIFFDKEKKLVACEKIVNYRLYPTFNGFGVITVGYPNFSASGKIEYLRIYKPNGKFEELKTEEIPLKSEMLDGVEMQFASINMSQYSKEDKHLIIEFKIIEYGYDHWIMAAIQTLQPTDGISYRIRCEDEIKIITCDTFGQGIDFNVDKCNNDTEISVSSYQWLNDGAGICIIASNTKTTAPNYQSEETDKT